MDSSGQILWNGIIQAKNFLKEVSSLGFKFEEDPPIEARYGADKMSDFRRMDRQSYPYVFKKISIQLLE